MHSTNYNGLATFCMYFALNCPLISMTILFLAYCEMFIVSDEAVLLTHTACLSLDPKFLVRICSPRGPEIFNFTRKWDISFEKIFVCVYFFTILETLSLLIFYSEKMTWNFFAQAKKPWLDQMHKTDFGVKGQSSQWRS